MKKTKLEKTIVIRKILLITFHLSLFTQFSCGNYSGFDSIFQTGKVKSDKEDKIKADAQEKIDAENKVKAAEAQAKIDAENKAKSEEKIKEKTSGSMIKVEGGNFDMGSNSGESDEKPIHKVTVSSFYISKYETTQEEYQNIMGNNPSNFKVSNLPVEYVSWFDAIKFCNAKSKKDGLSVAYNETSGELLDSSGNVTTDITKVKGYRLPTEAEWEYSARGGNKSQGYTYSAGNSLEEVAWFSSNSGNKTHEVGTKKANELGIYDMSGNVSEWCTDWYGSNYYENSTDINPVNTKSSGNRVNRGGSWLIDPDYLRVGNRTSNTPTGTIYYLGFRLAKTY